MAAVAAATDEAFVAVMNVAVAAAAAAGRTSSLLVILVQTVDDRYLKIAEDLVLLEGGAAAAVRFYVFENLRSAIES
jgi:hypothetical protein